MLKLLRWNRSVLSAMTLTVTLCAASAHAVDAELVQRLKEETGAKYVEARDEALQLDQAGFDNLLAELRNPEHEEEGQFAAHILSVRRQYAEDCARFDEAFVEATSSPNKRAWRPLDSTRLDGLILEGWLKFESARESTRLRRQLLVMIQDVGGTDDDPRELIDGLLLFVTEEPNLSITAAKPLARLARTYDDSRVLPALTEIYILTRTNHPDDPRACHFVSLALRDIGTLDALATAQQLLQLEQGFAQQQGLTPWSDEDARDNHRNAAQAMVNLRTGTPEYDEAYEALKRARVRLGAKDLWNSLNETITEIASNNPPEEPD